MTLPLSGFSDYWDDATGEAIKTCQENKIYCSVADGWFMSQMGMENDRKQCLYIYVNTHIMIYDDMSIYIFIYVYYFYVMISNDI